MTETSKIKIGFALALLGVLFTLSPIIKESSIELNLFTFLISINTIYWIFAILLGISVYCYGVTLVGEKRVFDYIKSLGNIIYSVTLLFPLIVFVLYIVSLISFWVYDILKSDYFRTTLQFVLSGFVGVIATVTVTRLTKFLSKKERTEKIDIISEKSSATITKIKILVDNEFYELAILEVWKMIEFTLDKVLISNNLNFNDKSAYSKIINAKSLGLIDDEDYQQINEIRELRNMAAHSKSTTPITKDLIESMIKRMDKVLSKLENEIMDSCYNCNKKEKKSRMNYSNILGIYVCNDCAIKNPNWEGDYISMGMDP